MSEVNFTRAAAASYARAIDMDIYSLAYPPPPRPSWWQFWKRAAYKQALAEWRLTAEAAVNG